MRHSSVFTPIIRQLPLRGRFCGLFAAYFWSSVVCVFRASFVARASSVLHVSSIVRKLSIVRRPSSVPRVSSVPHPRIDGGTDAKSLFIARGSSTKSFLANFSPPKYIHAPIVCVCVCVCERECVSARVSGSRVRTSVHPRSSLPVF